jgi:hypothetical protein
MNRKTPSPYLSLQLIPEEQTQEKEKNIRFRNNFFFKKSFFENSQMALAVTSSSSAAVSGSGFSFSSSSYELKGNSIFNF